jgi:hypothetical protein
MVWSEGMPDWIAADAVPDLFSKEVPHPLLKRIGGNDCLQQFPMVIGRSLLVPSGTKLPLRCVKTNAPVSESDMVRKEFYWLNPLWLLTIFVGLFVILVVYFVARKKCMVTYGLSPQVRKKYQTRMVIKIALMLALFLAFLFSTTGGDGTLIAVTVCLFVFSLIILPFGNVPIVVKKFDGNRFWFKGCGPEFLESITPNNP